MTRCTRDEFRGWVCNRGAHLGPCALHPAWWNLLARLRFSGWL